jgi:peptidoglycan/LPS O-acetylase OafA/YrhL
MGLPHQTDRPADHGSLRNERFPALTGIRAVAAFMVFFNHLPLLLKPGSLMGVQYTLTHNLFFVFKTNGIAIGPSWSLTVEECFYLLAPFIFILSRKYNLGLPFFLTFLLTILLYFTYCQDKPFFSGLFAILWDSFFGRFLEFFIGIYLALLVRRKEGGEGGPAMPVSRGGIAAEAATKKWTWIGMTGILILFLPLVYVTNKSDALRWPVMITVNNFLLPFPIAILYFGLISEASLLRRFLSSGGMRLAGRSSYAFYLLHIPVIDCLGTPYLRKYFGGGGSYNLYVLTIFIMTLALSVILFLIFEEPLNRRIRKSFLYFSRLMA